MPPCRSVPDTIEELRCAARQHAFWRSTRRWPVPSNRRRRPPTVSICRERGRAWQWHTERHHEWMISPSSSWQPLHCREQSVEHLQRLHTCGCSWFHGLQPFMEQFGGTAAPCSCIAPARGHQAIKRMERTAHQWHEQCDAFLCIARAYALRRGARRGVER